MEALFWLGRILYGGFFILNGINHFMRLEAMSGYAQSKGVPASRAAVAVTGLMILLGGLAVLTGLYVQAGLWLLVIFLVFVSFWMHNFWAIEDPMRKMTEQVNFMKNMGLLGAAFLLLYLWT
ncbi:MAG: DoxX family protein [Armatimonadota bacterium]|nr:DoxX family protein [Armatimonadota bacterium]MDR7570641.1 DoxX family protein [Armatimonadota bacterium]MDR7615293.1 DoxX family protein [Armatimonadota bacterium]